MLNRSWRGPQNRFHRSPAHRTACLSVLLPALPTAPLTLRRCGGLYSADEELTFIDNHCVIQGGSEMWGERPATSVAHFK